MFILLFPILDKIQNIGTHCFELFNDLLVLIFLFVFSIYVNKTKSNNFTNIALVQKA